VVFSIIQLSASAYTKRLGCFARSGLFRFRCCLGLLEALLKRFHYIDDRSYMRLAHGGDFLASLLGFEQAFDVLAVFVMILLGLERAG
jgi:hypothetical protein